MAEAANALTEKLTSMLVNKIFQEVSVVIGFKEDFEFLCDTLASIKCMLNEVRDKSNSTLISNWIEKLEYFLYDAVYIVDECGAHIVDECGAAVKSGNQIFANRICRRIRGLKQRINPIYRYRMGCKIRDLKKRIISINRSARYIKLAASVLDVNAFHADNLEDNRERSNAFIKEIQTVGMNHEVDQITELILKKDNTQVIAVLGMGGLGKTLLVDQVFKSQKIQERFSSMVWLSLSSNFVVKQILLEVAEKIKLPRDEIGNLSEKDLMNKIDNHLQEGRSLFVLDNLWNKKNVEHICWLWQNKSKYKIVITTRDRNVAEAMPLSVIHSVEPLKETDSWDLFCIHAFPERVNNYPPEELTTVARDIAKRCGGLPLAIKTVGASMAKVRRLPNDWDSILNRLNEAEAMTAQVMPSLKLSYQSLPYPLKLCFLYFSAFPKNSQMQSEYLVYAWVGEGFTSELEDENPYDAARRYIDELVNRCLIEVSQFGGDGRGKYFKMHDLIHDLALSECKKQTKCLSCPAEKLDKLPLGKCKGLRRISIIKNDISTIEEPIECPGLRTLLLQKNISLESISRRFFKNLRYLAVIDLSETSINSLPASIGNLKYLKFLNLSRTKIAKLPKSLSGLRSLQYLDVSYCEDLCELHPGIGEHKSMAYLNVKGSGNLKWLPVGISNLTYLQTLKGAVFKRGKAAHAKALLSAAIFKGGNEVNAKALQLRHLKKLTLLEHLSLTIHALEDITPFEEGTLGSMTKMRVLSLHYINSSEDPSSCFHLPRDIKEMKHLEIVHLKCCVVPNWISELHNLVDLELHGDNSSSEDYGGLEKIPNLAKLKLSSNKKCVEFPKQFEGPRAFPKLEKLIIEDFESLQKFPALQDETMPMLKYLELKNCGDLTDMPEALERLSSTLKEIEVERCPTWIDGLWNSDRAWDLLQEKTIKLTVNDYTICWERDKSYNRQLYNKCILAPRIRQKGKKGPLHQGKGEET